MWESEDFLCSHHSDFELFIMSYDSEGTCDCSLSLLGPSPSKSWVEVYC
jgi:hypothetical protein